MELDDLPIWLNLMDKVKHSFKNKLFPEIYDDIESLVNIQNLKLPIRLLDGILKKPDYLTRLVKRSMTKIINNYNFAHLLSHRSIMNVNEPDVVLESIHKASEKVRNPILVFLTIDSEDIKTTSKLINKLISSGHEKVSSVVFDLNFDNSIRKKVISLGYPYVEKANRLSGESIRSIFKGSIEQIINKYHR